MKEFSILIALKNRTYVLSDYEPIQLKTFMRHTIQLSGFKHEPKLNKSGKIILPLLLNFLDSLEKIKHADEVFEVVICDFGSDDYNLNQLSNKYPTLIIKIVVLDEHFSRGRGLNVAYQNSTKSNIFFCDSDMFFTSHELFDIGYELLSKGKVFFPICADLCEPSHQLIYWRESGFGLNLMTRDTFDNVGYSWPELNSTGLEDNLLWDHFNKLGLCHRDKVNGYYHQWHSTSPTYKNMYYKCSDINKKKIFLNCKHINDVLSNENYINKIKTIENINDINDAYIVNKLEKFITTIITFDNFEKAISDADLINYKKTYNKNVKVINI